MQQHHPKHKLYVLQFVLIIPKSYQFQQDEHYQLLNNKEKSMNKIKYIHIPNRFIILTSQPVPSRHGVH